MRHQPDSAEEVRPLSPSQLFPESQFPSFRGAPVQSLNQLGAVGYLKIEHIIYGVYPPPDLRPEGFSGFMIADIHLPIPA